MGISAGAKQLGVAILGEAGPAAGMYSALGLAPFRVSVHEPEGWPALKAALRASGEATRGLGIPWGGGALVYPDETVEAVRHPLVEMRLDAAMPRQTLRYP